MSTIYILWLRELKRYFRSKARMAGSLGQPLLFLLALGFGLSPVFARAGEGNYFQFLGPGVISMSILFTAIFAGIQVIWDKEFGFLKETLVAPVSRLNIMIGKTLGGATVALIQGIIVFFLSLLVGFKPNFSLFPIAIIFMILIAVFFTALGIAIASTLSDMQGFQFIMNFIVQPLFFLSGALFPLDNLPKALLGVIKFDPLTYGVDGIRGALTGISHFGLGIDFIILLLLVLVVLAIGGYLFSKIEI